MKERPMLHRVLTVGDIQRAEKALHAYLGQRADDCQSINALEAVGIVVDAMAESMEERRLLSPLWPWEEEPSLPRKA